MSIGLLGTNFSEILIKILTFYVRKMRLKVLSAKWRPFCLDIVQRQYGTGMFTGLCMHVLKRRCLPVYEYQFHTYSWIDIIVRNLGALTFPIDASVSSTWQWLMSSGPFLYSTWVHFYQTRSAWSMDQGSIRKRSAVYNFVPRVTKFCVMWEGLSLPHDTKFGNCKSKIVDRRLIISWSLIHGSSWSGLIKVGPGWQVVRD